MPEPKLYAHRDLPSLEPHYCAHVSAMTSEGLHAKSAIAAELAWRDAEIDRLREENARLRAVVEALPRCDLDGCGRIATARGPAGHRCDEHPSVGHDFVWADAVRGLGEK